MIDVATLLVSLIMVTACPECAAAHARQMNDMAATPSSDSGSDSDASSGSSRVRATRWGAIATGNGAMGVAEMFGSQEAAERKAMQDCRDSAPGAVCRIQVAHYNQCAAIAWGDEGNIWARGPDIRQTEFDVMQRCGSLTANCQLLYSSCSYPE